MSIICYPLVDCLVAPATCGTIADCLPILVASLLPCTRRRLAVASPPLSPAIVIITSTSQATTTAIAIGIVGRYPYRCCCHHRRCSSHRRLRCLCCRCPDVSVAPDAPAAPPLPPSFVTDPTAVQLRLATVPRQQRVGSDGGGGVRRMRQRRPLAPPGRLPLPPGGRRTGCDNGGRRGDGGGEYGDRDDVNACDQRQHVVHLVGGSGGQRRLRHRDEG